MLILVLEHSESNKERVREMFVAAIPGAEVAIFSHMKDAYMFCIDHHPDVIFAELENSDDDCLAFVRLLWNEPENYNIVVVSGRERTPNIAIECFRMAVCDYLEKPLTSDMIEEALKGLRF